MPRRTAMSVQAGIWNLDGKPVIHELLSRLSLSVAEYGPDGETILVEGQVGISYRSFHTTSESRLEHQPYIFEDRKVITWDGRLDNRDALIDQLGNRFPDGCSDVAIVAAAFERWGTDCFKKLTGDWALAIWNPRKREIILARDYMGVRHLFYYPNPRRLIWCSHLAPLAFLGDTFTLCEDYIAGYLSLWPEAHLTPYREIRSVPPATFVCISHNEASIHPYWSFNPQLKTRYKTDAEYEEHFRYLLRQSIHRRLRTDSPILAELSGGLDSSSIVCVADDILLKQGSESPSLDTFSFYDRDEPDEEDFLYLTKVEERRGRPGHHAELQASGDTFPLECPQFFATPGFGARRELTTALSDTIRLGRYRVVLSGTGGDEFLGQALNPRVQMADLLLHLRLRELGELLVAWSLSIKRPLVQLFFQSSLLILPTSLRAIITPTAKRDSWVNSRFARTYRLSHRRLEAAEGPWLWLPSARDALQTYEVLARQSTYTQPPIAEMRYPYLDQQLTEFLVSIPTDQLLRPGDRRSLLRRALVDLVPPEILSRRTKAGTGRCISLTLDKHWTFLDGLLSSLLVSDLGYVNQEEFRAALKEAKNGLISVNILRLLKTLALEMWLREGAVRGVISIPSFLQKGSSEDRDSLKAGPSLAI